MGIRKIVKGICLRFLPEHVLFLLKKRHYSLALRALRSSDEADLEIVRHIVKAGDYVIDVGANFGLYTKFLSDLVGGNGKVFSIEPIPLTFKILSSNIKELGLGNVSPMNLAISDMEGLVEMEIPRYETGGKNYYQSSITTHGSENHGRRVKIERVMAKTIDDLFYNMSSQITFIKLDVEGHELNCINGSSKVRERSGAALLVEISDNPDELGSCAYRIFEILISEGYAPYWYDGLKLKPRTARDYSINYFFLTANHSAALKTKGLIGGQ
jgi:FkbM family methyltransferase